MMIPQRGGLPHSDIHGSKPARGSPWLFAACHVLHRLLVPRHPPNALIALHTRQALAKADRSPPCTGTIVDSPQTIAQGTPRTAHAYTQSSYSALYTNAPEHCRHIGLDDPWCCQPRSLPVRQITQCHDGPPCLDPTSATRQPNHNRVVLRAQRRTRTRFTTQKNKTAGHSPSGSTASLPTPRSRGQAQTRRSRIHPMKHRPALPAQGQTSSGRPRWWRLSDSNR